MPWEERSTMSERLRLCQLAHEGHYSMTELAEAFGVSRKTAYKWKARFEADGAEGIGDRSRRPHASPAATGAAAVAAVLEIRDEYPMWKARKLHRLLCDRWGRPGEQRDAAPSLSTVQRVLDRNGPTAPRTPPPRHAAVGRFERGRPNALWQVDFTAPFVLPSGRKLWPLPILDDHSRFCLHLCAVAAPTVEAARSAVEAAARRYGLPGEVLSDHGSAFGTSRAALTEFTVFLWGCGVEHRQGRRAHPQTQGKLERFNRSLEEEWIERRDYSTGADWDRSLEEYRQLYNTVRPHEAVGDRPPVTRYEPSEIPFTPPDKGQGELGQEWLHRRVDASGKIWLLGHVVPVGHAFCGWTVSARHDGQGYWTVSFRGRRLCQVQLARPVTRKGEKGAATPLSNEAPSATP